MNLLSAALGCSAVAMTAAADPPVGNPLDPAPRKAQVTNPLDPDGGKAGPPVANPLDTAGQTPRAAPGNPLDPHPGAVAGANDAWPPRDAAGLPLRQWGNIVFPLQPGWEIGHDDGVCEVRPEDWIDLDSYIEMRILPGAAGSGSAAVLQAWATEQVTRYYALENDDLNLTFMDWTDLTSGTSRRIMMSACVAREDDGDIEEVVAIAAFGAGGRHDLVIGVCDEPEAMGRHSARFTEFVSTLQLVSLTGRPLLGAPEAGPLSGVWWGTHIIHTLGLDGMMAMEVEHTLYTFYPDGRFYRGIPPRGTGDFRFAEIARLETDEVGNYAVRGGEILLRFADGDSDTLEFDGRAIQDGRATLTRATLPPDGYRFEGVRSWFFYSGFTPGLVSGGVSSSRTTVFLKDGSYADSRFTGAFGNFTDGGGGVTGGFATANEAPDQFGRYEVRGGRVFMTDPDGTEQSWTIHLATGQDGVVDIWLGEQVLDPR